MSLRSNVVLAIVGLGLLASAPTVNAASIFWANPVTGNWSVASNWSPPQVPGPTDVAFINVAGNYIVTADVNIDVQRIFIGNLTGVQTLIVDNKTVALGSSITTITLGGAMRLRNGTTVSGSGSITAGSLLELNASSISNLVTINGTLEVRNNAVLTGTVSTGGSSVIQFFDSATLTSTNGFTVNGDLFLTGDGNSIDTTTGTLTVAAGGVVDVSGAGAARSILSQLNNLGTVTVAQDLTLAEDSAAHTNSGNFTVTSGTVTLTQTGTTPSFTNSGSLLVSGDLIVNGGTVANTATGTVGGSGTIDVSASAFSNAGTVAPGTSAGALTITGDHTDAATSTLAIELGGLTPGSGYDQLNVSGTATIDGALDVSLISGFVPTPGDAFTVLTAGTLVGTYADTTSLELGGGVALVTAYDGTSLTLNAISVPLSDNVHPVDPGVCVTPSTPCLNIPFEFERTVADPVRAFTVTFSLSPELELCDGMNSITEGTYLSGFCGGGCTVFQKNDNLDGTYTVDGAILGASCGPTTTGGTLFEIDVQDSSGDGAGIIAVTSVTIRDCTNAPVAGDPGPALSIDIDLTVPSALADLATAQQGAGNDTDGNTATLLTFSGAEAGATVEIYRKGFGSYPEYDDLTGAVPTLPTDPSDAVSNGWTLTGVTTSGEYDEPATRDYWYYCAFIISPCGLISPASNMTDGVLNYHLGDVSDGVTPGTGDNAVTIADISTLGANYFATGAAVDPVNYLDVGPTDDFSTDGRPTTDNAIGFEDLIMFAINFGTVSLTEPVRQTLEIADATASTPTLSIERVGSGAIRPNGLLKTQLMLNGAADLVKGAHAGIEFDATRLELVSVVRSELSEGAQVFQAHQAKKSTIWLDTAVMGQGSTFPNSGALAELIFRVKNVQFALPSVKISDLRNVANQPIYDLDPARGLVSLTDEGAIRHIPARTQLMGARPNPFSKSSVIAFALSAESPFAVNIYDVSGRLVRDLAEGVLPAGEHEIRWDGTDRSGNRVASGVYFYTFQAGNVVAKEKIYLQR